MISIWGSNHVIAVAIIIFIARLAIWFIDRITKQFFQRKKIDAGRQYAFLQVAKYIIYTGSVLLVLETIDISLSILWGGAAALLVGVGLGLQQNFQ